MKLFDTAAKASSNGGEVRLEELSSEANADPVLVSRCSKKLIHLRQTLIILARVMRHLVGIGVFKEVGEGLFTSTNLVDAFVTGSTPTAGLLHLFVLQSPLSL